MKFLIVIGENDLLVENALNKTALLFKGVYRHLYINEFSETDGDVTIENIKKDSYS